MDVPSESNFDDDDTHICLKCQLTIIGLDNYILHRRSKCTGIPLEASTSKLSGRCVEPTEVSVENQVETQLPSALDFFSSLELMSKTRLDVFDIDFDIPNLPKSSLELSSKGSNFLRISDLELEPNFNLDIGDINKVRRSNYDALADLNLIQEDSIMGIDRARSILDSDIFSSAPIEKTVSPTPTENYSIQPTTRAAPPPFQTSGKWMPGKSDHLKSGSNIHYFCRTCNRRLSSRISYEKHLRSELHFKRKTESSLYEMEDELQIPQVRQRRCSKRFAELNIISKFELSKVGRMKLVDRIPGPNKKYTACEICNIKVPSLLFGKHLLSHYHYIKGCQNPQLSKELVLNNIEKVVKHFSFQCLLCQFYCNMTEDFLSHFKSDMHTTKSLMTPGKFCCQPCKFEETPSYTIEAHLRSEEHQQVVAALNQSVPILIKKKNACFSCKLCHKKFRLNIQLKHHLLKMHGLVTESLPIFTCKLCKFSCNKQRSLQRHMIGKHKSRQKRKQPLLSNFDYFCGICNETFQNKEDVALHRKQLDCRQKSAFSKGIDVKKKCKICQQIFESLVDYKKHIFEAHPGILHRCKKCSTAFAISQDLSRHSRSCSMPSNNMLSLTSQGNFFCTTCDKSFNRLRNLVYHQTHVHGSTQLEISKKLTCDVCKYTTVKKARLQEHIIAIHFKSSRLRNWTCEICDKRFYEKSQLKLHRNIHFPKQFKCEIENCRFEAAFSSVLQRHIVKYHQKGAFVCKIPNCNHMSLTKYGLKQHEEVHKRECSFKCSICNLIFSSEKTLKSHRKKLHKKEPFICPHCILNVETLPLLGLHILSVHHQNEIEAYNNCEVCLKTISLQKCSNIQDTPFVMDVGNSFTSVQPIFLENAKGSHDENLFQKGRFENIEHTNLLPGFMESINYEASDVIVVQVGD